MNEVDSLGLPLTNEQYSEPEAIDAMRNREYIAERYDGQIVNIKVHSGFEHLKEEMFRHAYVTELEQAKGCSFEEFCRRLCFRVMES